MTTYLTVTDRGRYTLYGENTYFSKGGNVLSRTPWETSNQASYTRSRAGVDLPNWRQIIKAGGNAVTGFTGYRQTIKVSPSSSFLSRFTDGSKTGYGHFKTAGLDVNGLKDWGDMNPMWIAYTSLGADSDNLARSRILKSIRKSETEMQGLIFLGEARETIRMLKNPLSSLRRFTERYLDTVTTRSAKIRKSVRRKRDEAKALNKMVADTWLEASFGWKPFLSDLSDGLSAYERLRDGFRSEKLRNNAKVGEVKQQMQQFTFHGQTPMVYNWVHRWEVETRYIVGLRYVTTASPSTVRNDMLGLKLSEFVPTIWELIPYSFLIDYVVNIGEMIDAGMTNQSNVTYVCKTVREKSIWTMTSHLDDAYTKQTVGDALISASGSGGSFVQEWTKITRSSQSSVAMPQLTVSLPSSPTKWANMAALLVSKGHSVSHDLTRRR